jgi:AcrR family transcriptional regulator
MTVKKTSTTKTGSLTKGERTRATIIEAANRLFIRQGFHATSMREIANEAGIALGGIYNHFHSKEDIYIGLIRERHPFLEVLPALQLAEGATVEALVQDAATRMITILSGRRGQRETLSLIYIELVEFNGRHVEMLFKMFYPPLMEFAQRLGQVEGPLRDVPLPTMLRAFLGLFFSYFITDLLIGSQLPADTKKNAFNNFVDIYLHGILAKG